MPDDNAQDEPRKCGRLDGHPPEDGEAMAFFDPRPGGYVLVLEFEDLASMFEAQENVMAMNRKFDEEGARLPEKVQTHVMCRALLGKRTVFDHFDLMLVAPNSDDLIETEAARRQWAADRSIRSLPVPTNVQMSEAWRPSLELQDWLEKWVDEAVETHPAGVDGPRVKTGAVRAGFNSYVRDMGRPDLQLGSSAGGRVMSAFVQARFQDEARRETVGSNVYWHGLKRRSDAKENWFPNLPAWG